MGKYFGTDGIRGIANLDLTPTLAYRVGLATAEVLAKNNEGRGVLIGKDTRKSGDMLEAALISGLTAGGLDVVTAGVLPTPGVAYLTRANLHAAGIVISASHNPGEYNGIKIFGPDGYKLPDRTEEEIEAHIDGQLPAPLTGMDIGSVRRMPDAAELYAAFLRERIGESLLGVSIALDCGHGATSDIAPGLFEALGAHVVVMNREPDGMNINRQCGSTNPELIRRLIQKTNSDLGFAFDGDGDRVIAVDEQGNIMDGDHILAALGRAMQREGSLTHNGIVGTVMTNIGLDRFCKENDMVVEKAPVGDRYVLELMREHGYVLGGEQSGHIIFLRHNTTGDGLLTALKLAELVVREKQPLSALNGLMRSYPQVLVNARVRADQKCAYETDTEIQEAIAALEASYHGEGRVLIRPSGTEPLVRVMIEGEDQERLNEDAHALAKKIEEKYGS